MRPLYIRISQGLPAALLGAALWGLSAVAAQVLFRRDGVPPEPLVALRMLASGALLYAWLRPPLPRRRLWRLLAFAVLGMAAMQFTYFAAIRFSNAATATLLQYLFLPAVALCDGLTARRAVAVAAAIVGTLLLVGGARPTATPAGLAFGFASAAAAAVNTLASRPLVAAYGAWATTTWGMLLGGLSTLPGVALPGALALPAHADPAAVAALSAFVVVCGTLLAFGLYLASLERIRPTEAAVATTAEPLTAAAVSVGILHTPFAAEQMAGGALILAAAAVASHNPGDRRASRLRR